MVKQPVSQHPNVKLERKWHGFVKAVTYLRSTLHYGTHKDTKETLKISGDLEQTVAVSTDSFELEVPSLILEFED